MTVSDILDAIDQNGLEHVRGWYSPEPNGFNVDTIRGGCALTQAAYNLNNHEKSFNKLWPKAYQLHGALNKILVNFPQYGVMGLGTVIVELNDSPIDENHVYRTLKEITDYVRNNYPEVLALEVDFAGTPVANFYYSLQK